MTAANRSVAGSRRLLAFLAIEALLLLAGAEGFIALTRLDMRLLRPLLHYQGADLEVHRVSGDVALHYELRPSTAAVFARYGNERGLKEFTINSLGFRGKERSAGKPDGVKRIFCIGASNTYGPQVGDQETYPAFLEALLNRRSRGKFEVWNAGVSAYVLSQNVAQAGFIVDHYSPDLLIFQVSNRGRRPFLLDAPLEGFFERDPTLYCENLPHCPARLMGLLGRWRLFRTLVIAFNRLEAPSAGRRPPGEDLFPVDDDFNVRAFIEFERRYRGKVPMFFLSYRRGVLDRRLQALGIPNIDLGARPSGERPRHYDDIHPPAYVYRWYAKTIREALVARGWLPGA